MSRQLCIWLGWAAAALAAGEAGASITICTGSALPGPVSREYVIQPESWIALEGSGPVSLSGSMQLSAADPCELLGWDGIFANIDRMEAAGIDSAISSPPDPVSVGGATIGAGPGVVFSRYIEDEGGTLAHGASAVIEQWAEPIDDDEAHVHRIWFERDPGGSSSIDWLSPGYYPTRLDVTLRVSTGSLLCHGFPSGGYGCSGEGTPETIGSMRLVATIPEPNSVAQTAGATIALAVLARRRKCVQNLSRRAIRASGRRLT